MIAYLHNYLQVMPLFVQLAFWMSLVCLLLTGAALVCLLWIRLRTLQRQKVQQEVLDRWKPILRAIRQGRPVKVPVVRQELAHYLLEQWLEDRELANDDHGARLDQFASEAGLKDNVARLTSHYPIKWLAPDARAVMIAARAARWIDSEEIRDNLYDLADRDSLALAVQASESLLYLDDKDATHLAVRLLFRFPEHDNYITTRLGAAGGEKVILMLDPFLENLPSANLEDFVYLIERSDNRNLVPVLERLLDGERTDEELASILRALSNIGSAAQRDRVLGYLGHPTGYVRLQAASALRRTGLPADRDRLIPMLSDPDWWIRYRAAESYIALTRDNDLIQSTIDSLTDPYARDILRHARSERTWHLI